MAGGPEAKKNLEAARGLERNGNLDAAGALYLRAGAFDDSIRCYLAGGKFGDAGRVMLASIGYDPGQAGSLDAVRRKTALKAAICFGKSGETRGAVELYLVLGEKSRALDLLRSIGDFVNAARVERSSTTHVELVDFTPDSKTPVQTGHVRSGVDATRRLKMLMEVPRENDRYREVCVQVVQAAEEAERMDFQIDNYLGKFIDGGPASAAEAEVFYRLGGVYERHEMPESARECYKKVLAKFPGYKDAGQKVQHLNAEVRGSARVIEKIYAEESAFKAAVDRHNTPVAPASKPAPAHTMGDEELPDLPDLPSLPDQPSAVAAVAGRPPAAAMGRAATVASGGAPPAGPLGAVPGGVPAYPASVYPPPSRRPPPNPAYPPPQPPAPYPPGYPPPGAHGTPGPYPPGYPPPGAHGTPGPYPVYPPPYAPPPPVYQPTHMTPVPQGAMPPHATPVPYAVPPSGTPITGGGVPVGPMGSAYSGGAGQPPVATGPPVALAEGAVVNGRYRLEKKIGQGGMGAVYKATDLELEEVVAIKFLSAAGADETLLQRFKQEVTLSRQLNHPNVIRLYDLGTYGEHKYISMELLSGRDLSKHLDDKAMDLDKGLAYLVQACTALQAVHDRGIVHRDVKPENFFVTEDGVVKVMDFGIAKRSTTGAGAAGANKGLTRAGMMAGTPQYMAPEQINDLGSVNHLADIYSLGIIAYQMFTGAVPFDNEELMPILIAHMSEEPAPPRTKNSKMPAGLEKLILKLLAKKPRERLQSCRELAAEFARIRMELK